VVVVVVINWVSISHSWALYEFSYYQLHGKPSERVLHDPESAYARCALYGFYIREHVTTVRCVHIFHRSRVHKQKDAS
jgi:hypothetical protein